MPGDGDAGPEADSDVAVGECVPLGEVRIVANDLAVTSDCVADPGELSLFVRPDGECQGDGRCSVLDLSPGPGHTTHECVFQADPFTCGAALACDPREGVDLSAVAGPFRGFLTATPNLILDGPEVAHGTVTIEGGDCVATVTLTDARVDSLLD